MEKIRVRLAGGALAADQETGRWTCEGHVPPDARARARAVISAYRYEPWHGYPGYLLASKVAEAVGGVAELPPLPVSKGRGR